MINFSQTNKLMLGNEIGKPVILTDKSSLSQFLRSITRVGITTMEYFLEQDPSECFLLKFCISHHSQFKGTVSRDFWTLVFCIILFYLTSLFMTKKDFANFCNFTMVKALLCHSPLPWTALSNFLALVNPKVFFIKNYGPYLKEHSYKILCFLN